MSKTVSRRAFLTSAATATAGIAAASAFATSAFAAGGPGGGPGGPAKEVVYASAETTDDGRVKGYCGPGDWLGTKPEIAEDQITQTYDVDVVVLGGGHAGLMATLGAVDEGCTVATVEQQPWSAFVDLDGTGANMGGWYGEDIGHVNSQFLIDRGFGPYNTGEIAAEFCKRAAGRVNPNIIKAFVQNSGAMFDRYKEVYDSYEEERKANDSNVHLTGTLVVIDGEPAADEGDFDMSNMFDYPLCNTQAAWSGANVEYPIECGGYKTWPCNAQFYGYHGNDIEFVHKYIKQYTEENGATWYFEHTGVELVQNEAGDVTGLIATDADGNYVQFNAAKGVILCSGDYIGDPKMCWALLNEGMEWGERAGATAEDWASAGSRSGAGHKMGIWAGGMIEPTPRGWMAIGGGASGPWGTCPLLTLNSEGKRFCNEGAIAQLQAVCLRQPAGLSCYVTDANWKQTVGSAPLDHGAPNFGMDDYMVQLEAGMNVGTSILVGKEECVSPIGSTHLAVVNIAQHLVSCTELLLTGLVGEGDVQSNHSLGVFRLTHVDLGKHFLAHSLHANLLQLVALGYHDIAILHSEDQVVILSVGRLYRVSSTILGSECAVAIIGLVCANTLVESLL